jgi:hypothetical protein
MKGKKGIWLIILLSDACYFQSLSQEINHPGDVPSAESIPQ